MPAFSDLLAQAIPLLPGRWTIGAAFLLALFLQGQAQLLLGALLVHALVAASGLWRDWLREGDAPATFSWEATALSLLACAGLACLLLATRRWLERGRHSPFIHRLVLAMRGATLGAAVGGPLFGLAAYLLLALAGLVLPEGGMARQVTLAALSGGLAGAIVGGALGRRSSLWRDGTQWRRQGRLRRRRRSGRRQGSGEGHRASRTPPAPAPAVPAPSPAEE